MNPYKTSHTVVTPKGTYTTTLEFTPAAESAPDSGVPANWSPPFKGELA